jgi:hypothetical protein
MWGTLGSIENLNIPDDGKPQEEWDLSTFDPIQDICDTQSSGMRKRSENLGMLLDIETLDTL